MRTSFPWSPKSSYSANVSACLRAVHILCLLDRSTDVAGRACDGLFCREMQRASPGQLICLTSLVVFCHTSGKLARHSAPPTEGGGGCRNPSLLSLLLCFHSLDEKVWGQIDPDQSEAVNKKASFQWDEGAQSCICLCNLKNATCHLKPQAC